MDLRAFPREPQVGEYVTELPASGRHGQEHDSAPLRVAEFSLYDEPDGQANERRPETAAATVELGRNYCGLTGAAKTDIRVELFSVAYADFPVGHHGRGRGSAGGGRAGVPVANSGPCHPECGAAGCRSGGRGRGVVVKHCLYRGARAVHGAVCVESDGVPNVSEMPGKISLHEGDVESPQGRMTTLTQLVPITDAELVFYEQQGPCRR